MKPSMNVLAELLSPGSVPQGLALLALVVALGIAAGNARILGVRFGVAAVMFVAVLFGQFNLTIDAGVLEYFRDFALVLFVYTLGLQMGPGFFSSLKSSGLKLNLLAVAVVSLGALMTAGIVRFAHLPREQVSGLYAGGFATTPSLAAGEESLRSYAAAHHGDAVKMVARTDIAYSVAYPFGIAGPILLVIGFRWFFKVNIKNELKQLQESEQVRRPRQAVMDIEVTQPAIVGTLLRDKCFLQSRGVLFSRLLRGGEQSVPTASTALAIGDVYRAIGPKPALDELTALMGQPSQVNLAEMTGVLKRRELVVTHSGVLGKSLRELDLINRYGVTVGKVERAGVEIPLRAGLTFHFGDSVVLVGPEAGIASAETELGNSTEALNQTQLIPLFLGICLGVIVGSIPIALPGLATPVRVGLAGGPMIVAILLSRVGNIGPVVWYMPAAAIQIARDFGMAVFLACVGLQSGDHFFQKLLDGGLPLVAWGASITIVPMLLVGLFARVVMKMNYITLAGLISGAMTSSPTLLFANEEVGSSAPAVAYATVYPLSMLVPVFCSQMLVTAMMR